jgi:hypothetical protein
MSKQKDINFYTRDDGIIVFEFYTMDKSAADHFAAIIKASAANVPEKLRVLYDFQHSPPPTRYFLKIQSELYNEFPHPDDEKSAYVTGVWNNEVWIRIVRSYIVPHDVMKVFRSQDDAIVWLLE